MTLINCKMCNHEISPNASVCPHCGEPNHLEDVETSEMNKIESTETKHTKKNIWIMMLIAIVVVLICWLLVYQCMKANNRKAIIEELQYGDSLKGTRMLREYEAKYGYENELILLSIKSLQGDITDNSYAEVPNIGITVEKYDGEKVSFSVKNESEQPLTYLKFDIRIYDSSGNVIDTDWTNWSGNLKANDSAKIDAFISKGESVEVTLAEWN